MEDFSFPISLELIPFFVLIALQFLHQLFKKKKPNNNHRLEDETLERHSDDHNQHSLADEIDESYFERNDLSIHHQSNQSDISILDLEKEPDLVEQEKPLKRSPKIGESFPPHSPIVGRSFLKKVLKNKRTFKQAIILNEIIGKPKGF